MIVQRWAARLLFASGPACFVCGRWGDNPCIGHEYGGTILQWRRRRFAPFWLARYVDCRWSL